MRYWLVMPAAGSGRRFGEQTPKQYATLHGRSVIEWALSLFLADARCAGVVVVLADRDPRWPDVAARLQPGSVRIAIGGDDRSRSVRNGLAALEGHATADDWVLVHDAARPCLPAADLENLLVSLQGHPVGGLLAARAADTLKEAGAQLEISRTVDRSQLWRALTPQMFRFGRLCEALDAARAAARLPTDESQALEWLGDVPRLVEGSAANIKVTTAEDLRVAEALLDARVSAV
jgi:2-C-methyl-D-erythritol 4-phosphate cytidylyltransferase